MPTEPHRPIEPETFGRRSLVDHTALEEMLRERDLIPEGQTYAQWVQGIHDEAEHIKADPAAHGISPQIMGMVGKLERWARGEET